MYDLILVVNVRTVLDSAVSVTKRSLNFFEKLQNCREKHLQILELLHTVPIVLAHESINSIWPK